MIPLIEAISLKSATLLPLIFAAAPPVAVIVIVSVPELAETVIPVPPAKLRASEADSGIICVPASPSALTFVKAFITGYVASIVNVFALTSGVTVMFVPPLRSTLASV